MTKKPPVVVLGVTGGIAACKAAELCSLLAKREFDVHVIMTENALRFVGELTFRTLSRNPVVTSLWDRPQWQPEHVALASRASLFIVAPATANFIAKMSCGIADDALSTFAATYSGPTVIAPAMNPAMWAHPACRRNVAELTARGVIFAGPETGHVACGPDGTGRMSEPEAILSLLPGL